MRKSGLASGVRQVPVWEFSPNASLPGSLVYTPIETWTNDDVWMFLTQVKNPWGYNNRDLMGMYAGERLVVGEKEDALADS